jgi:hypothetical protein
MRRWLAGLIVGILAGCGDPNVPLTRPPDSEFRVSTPRPPRIDSTPTPQPTPTPTPTPDPNQPSLATLTARFLGIPWQEPEPPPTLMELTARYFGIPIPTPRPLGIEGIVTDQGIPALLEGLDLSALEALGIDLNTLDLDSPALASYLETLRESGYDLSDPEVREFINNLTPEDIQNWINLGRQYGIDVRNLLPLLPTPPTSPDPAQ